jgi:hypothetical protein
MLLHSLLSLFFLFASTSHCWLAVGHAMTASIAYDSLTPGARQRLVAVLSTMASLYPASFPDPLTAANWPDVLKTKTLDALDALHFTDMPVTKPGWSGVLPPPPTGDDVLFGLKTFLATLQSETSDSFSRAVATSYLIHLTGDIHQPLHCASLFSSAFPTGDLGGNLVPIVYGPGATKVAAVDELHLWVDAGAGLFEKAPADYTTQAGLAYVRKTGQSFASEFPLPAPSEDIFNYQKWADESHTLAKDAIYVSPPVNNTFPTNTSGLVITADFQASVQRLIKQRIAQGGQRLGRVLEALYGNHTGPLSRIVQVCPSGSASQGTKAFLGICIVALIFSLAGNVFQHWQSKKFHTKTASQSYTTF